MKESILRLVDIEASIEDGEDEVEEVDDDGMCWHVAHRNHTDCVIDTLTWFLDDDEDLPDANMTGILHHEEQGVTCSSKDEFDAEAEAGRFRQRARQGKETGRGGGGAPAAELWMIRANVRIELISLFLR